MSNSLRKIIMRATILGLLALNTGNVAAQSGYPDRPITIVVGSQAGSAPDVLARIIAVPMGGLVIADAPRWMFIGLFLWWTTCAVIAIYWQRQGRCIDTY